MSIEWAIFPIIFMAFFIQAFTGFGSALVAMPLLIALVGVETAAPLFALIAQIAGIGFLIKYRDSWNWRAVWRVALASLLAIPAGVWGARQLDQDLVLSLLGLFTLAYALFALGGLVMPAIKQQRWAYGFGFIAGLLHGAYNTGGPPLVMYGTSQQWQPGEFKSNLQSLFFINGILTISTHVVTGHMSTPIIIQFIMALPVVFIAQQLGFSLDKYINPALFRKAVLVLLVILGIRMLF